MNPGLQILRQRVRGRAYAQHTAPKGMKGYARGTSGIHIKPSHKGLFTKKARAAGQSVQGFAGKVLSAPKGRYSAATRRQANFARNAKKWG